MENLYDYLFYIGQGISALTSLIVLIASIIIFIKKRTLATSLILIGTILSGITFIGGTLISVFVGKNDIEMLLVSQGIASIVQSLSYLIFAIGFILLAISEFSKYNS